MSILDNIKARLHARADLNGDGKVDKGDVEAVIEQAAEHFNDDRTENLIVLAAGAFVGAFSMLIYLKVFA